MARYNLTTCDCPVCDRPSVERITGQGLLARPTHRCTSCGATLYTKFTRDVWWAVPVLALTGGVILVVVPLIQRLGAYSTLLAACVMGGFVSLAYYFPYSACMKGVVYIRWPQ